MISTIFQQLKQTFTRKKPKLKDTLNIVQSANLIHVDGHLSNSNYHIKGLYLKMRGTEDTINIPNEQDGHLFKFTIDINKYESLLGADTAIIDFYLYVRVPETEFTPDRKARLKETATILQKDDMTIYEYTIRLGRFKETDFKIEKRMPNRYLYPTVRGNISLSINQQAEQKIVTQIDYLTLKNGILKLGGRLFTRSHRLQDLKLVLLGRETNKEKTFAVNYTSLTELTKIRFGLNRYEYDVSINMDDMIEHTEKYENVYDLFFDLSFKDGEEARRVRLGRPRFRAKRSLQATTCKKNGHVYTISPYYTFRMANLSLLVERFTEDTYSYMEKAMRWSSISRLVNRKKNIWLIGERNNQAQDTGYHLFKYIRKNYPHLNVYYVIKEDSPELDNIKHLGNVLMYKSKEHIKMTLAATRIIGSHHPDYLYPVRSDSFKKKVKGAKVFLQHGVMGTKNMVANYGKKTSGFETDLFLVSSDREKELVVNDLEYNKSEVAITGLSRFDALFKQDVTVKRQLLIIPTWREWLIREDLFLESEYFERYKDLIHNEQLHNLADTYNFEIVFCLHTNMQKYSSYFEDAPVRVIRLGDANVQHLMKESMMMITDYSSVGFDFSFLNRPVVYYQFDQQQFFGKTGSHLDIQNDLPGDIVYTEKNLIEAVEAYAKGDFAMKRENQIKASSFLKYRDQHSSERIFQTISSKLRRKSLFERVGETELYRLLFNRFRRSKWYHPTMRLFYKIISRLLPIDQKLIVFESGVGKQYADSPKYIYEEMIKRNLDYKIVWACNKITRFNDDNTKRIRRYSPSYYYYLARAKAWVNNQNYPARLKKRRGTTYIQTWHGTPLKKMLFDIDQVMGRTPGYVKRISTAVDMWDYLLSPSQYATRAFKSAFKYEGEIIETGYPRNDLFYQKDKSAIQKKIKNRLIIPEDKKVILYAPTFRDNQSVRSNRFVFDLKLDLERMREKLGNKYIVLLRMHVAITNKINIDEELEDFVLDVSDYSDMQELLLITDILITDYSSVMFDFANTKKPMLFFTYDLEMYRDKVRGFYMDFENEAPGPLVKTTDEVINNIQNIQLIQEEYEDKYNEFYETYCSNEDGQAASRVVDVFFDAK